MLMSILNKELRVYVYQFRHSEIMYNQNLDSTSHKHFQPTLAELISYHFDRETPIDGYDSELLSFYLSINKKKFCCICRVKQGATSADSVAGDDDLLAGALRCVCA